MLRFQKPLLFAAFSFIFTSICAQAQVRTPIKPAAPKKAMVRSTPISLPPARLKTVALGGVSTLAKFEPERGCYVGAFIELDHIVNGKIDEFEKLTQKKHASYFTYRGYGMPFPKEWV